MHTLSVPIFKSRQTDKILRISAVFLLASLPSLVRAEANTGSEAAKSEKLPAPRVVFRDAERAFAASNYAEAAEAFLKAASAASAADADPALDPAIPTYNAGLAALAAGDYALATNLFAAPVPAGGKDDLRHQSEIAFNQGCLLYRQAQDAMEGQSAGIQDLAAGGGAATAKAPDATATAEAAVQAFKRSILLDPDNLSAKQNYELALALKQQAMEQQQQQQQNQEQQGDKNDEEQQDQEQQENQSESEDTQENEQQQQQEEEQQQQQQEQQSSSSEENEQEQQAQQAESEDGEEMSAQEAEMLLDAMSDQEQSQRDRLHLMLGRPVPVEKDW